MPRPTTPTTCLLLLLLPACADPAAEVDGPSSADDGPDEAAFTYTWHADVAPLVASACAGCHTDGAIAPFSLTTYEEAAAVAPILGPAIESGAMPPWPAAPGCNEYANDRSLTEAERELLLTWIDEGAPEGDPADAAPLPEPPPAWVPDTVLEMPEAYTPTQEPDDYRCFLVDGPELDATRFVTGLEVYPGERAIVHHVIAFVVDPGELDAFEAYDAADPGPGYTCFGGPTGDMVSAQQPMIGVRWLGSWVPGSEPWTAPAGTGMRIEPGSKLVVQMHYNTSSATPIADRSAIGLTLEDTVERPAMMLPFTNFAWVLGSEPMAIPAGEASVSHSYTTDRASPFLSLLLAEIDAGPEDTLWIGNAGLHMHLLGRQAKIAVEHADGEASCLAEVDDWDFGWQIAYRMTEAVAFAPDDRLSITCEWDNSAENQPIVDGQIGEPRDVEWGEGSFDEMCLGVLYVSR